MSVSRMQRLTVFAFREDADRILRKLMGLRCVEVRNADPSRGASVLGGLNAEAEIAEADKKLATVREAVPILQKYCTHRKGLARRVLRTNRTEFAHDGRADAAFQTVEQTLALAKELNEITATQTGLFTLCEALTPWLELDLSLNDRKTAKTETVFGIFPQSLDVDALTEILGNAGVEANLVSSGKSGHSFTLTFLTEDEQNIQPILISKGFQKVELPEKDGTPQAVFDRSQIEIEKLDEQFEQVEEKLRDLADKKDDVEILCDVIETNRITAKLKQKLAETGHCAILDGWVPFSAVKAVGAALEKFECAFELDDPAEGEEPPVLLHNNGFASNFEWVIGMYSYPKYGTFDPTFIMSIFYFIIFGLMFADAGYGAILSILCFGGIKLLNPRESMKRMLMMFGFCGISSAIMGVLFGGWFGDLPTAVMQNMLGMSIDTSVGHFFSGGLWLNPLDDPMTFLIISLGAGAVHLITGMAIKFYILCKDRQPLEAVCTILPYWVLFAGFGCFAIEAAKPYAAYIALAGALMILFLNGYGQKSIGAWIIKGLGGLYSLISYASDLLSYSRVLALGMVAGVIAKVINMITALGATGPIGFVVMLVILLAGHGLNIGINILGTFVHAARLQYIEFFGKFFEDGGQPFDPALPAEEFSEDVEEVPTK